MLYNLVMIEQKEIEKYTATYSVERLTSFIYSENDTIEDVTKHYVDNMKISQALYPALCTLEIIFRNAIDTVMRTCFSETWIEDEIKNNAFLENSDYQLLISTYETTKKECKSASKDLTAGKIIANLNFGFWTNICTKRYSAKIWNKKHCFKGVFINYPSKRPEIAIISKKLYAIRKLRNRIFHYEQIFRYPEKTLSLYNNILEILSYLPNDELNILEAHSTFLSIYNKLAQERCIK